MDHSEFFYLTLAVSYLREEPYCSGRGGVGWEIHIYILLFVYISRLLGEPITHDWWRISSCVHINN